MLLVVAASALGKPVTPKTGVFEGTAEAAGGPGAGRATFKVSKSGKKVGVEMTIALNLICQFDGQSLPLPIEVSSREFKQQGNGASLVVKGGKFSYTGAIYTDLSATPGSAEISGTFKSPTKLAGTASFSFTDVPLTPGQSGPCESGKLTLVAAHT